MTIQQMAQDAIAIQDASNLSGVVLAFNAIVQAMRTEHGMDTLTCNTHPVCILLSDKIACLTGSHESRAVLDAYKACERLAHPYEHSTRG